MNLVYSTKQLLMLRLQFWNSADYEVILYCHYSQVQRRWKNPVKEFFAPKDKNWRTWDKKKLRQVASPNILSGSCSHGLLFGSTTYFLHLWRFNNHDEVETSVKKKKNVLRLQRYQLVSENQQSVFRRTNMMTPTLNT